MMSFVHGHSIYKHKQEPDDVWRFTDMCDAGGIIFGTEHWLDIRRYVVYLL